MQILLNNTIELMHYNQLFSLIKNHNISESKIAEKKIIYQKSPHQILGAYISKEAETCKLINGLNAIQGVFFASMLFMIYFDKLENSFEKQLNNSDNDFYQIFDTYISM